MTPQSRTRLSLAKKIAAPYARHPQVKAVFAFGSVGNGFADDYSDLELGVIWSQAPSPTTLHALAVDAGGEGWACQGIHDKKLSYGDAFSCQALHIEPAHWIAETIDRIIDEVILRYDVSQNMLMYERQATVATLVRCLAFSGHDYLRTLRTRVADYPRPLALAMIRRNLGLGPIDMFAMMATRGEIPLFFDHLAGRIRAMHSLLFALNSIYHPSFKWSRFFLREARIIPPHFEQRVDDLYSSKLATVVQNYRTLALEMFALVAQHFPEIDLAEAQRAFFEPLPKWLPLESASTSPL